MVYALDLQGEGTGGVRLVVPEKVIGHLSDQDRIAVRLGPVMAPSLSQEFKVAALTVAGISNADIFRFDRTSAKLKGIPLNHLSGEKRAGVVIFTLTHQSELPSEVKGASSKTKAGDRIIFDKIVAPPHFEGEYNDPNQKYTAEVHLSVRVQVRDSVFLQGYQGGGLAFVSDAYVWSQALSSMGPDTIQRIIGGAERQGLRDTYAAGRISYPPRARGAEFAALEQIINQPHDSEVFVLGKNRTLVRKGMGVSFDIPYASALYGSDPWMREVHGSVVSFESDPDGPQMIVRLHLAEDNIPPWLLSNLHEGELLQTNALIRMRADHLVCSFRLYPAQLYHGACSPDPQGFNDKIVIGDLKFGETQSEMQISCIQIISGLNRGEHSVTIQALKPVALSAIPAIFHHINAVHGGISPHPQAYVELLAEALRSYAKSKTAHAKNTNSIHTFKAEIPGKTMVELMFQRVHPEKRIVSLRRNGGLAITVEEGDLPFVFGKDVLRHDFISDGFGTVRLYGPFIFIWQMHDRFGATLEGPVTITVDSFTEYNRHGEMIKSTKTSAESMKAGGALRVKGKRTASLPSAGNPEAPEARAGSIPQDGSSSQALKKAAKEKSQSEVSDQRNQRAMRRSLGSVQLSSTDSLGTGEHSTSGEELEVLGGGHAGLEQHDGEMGCAGTECLIDLSGQSPSADADSQPFWKQLPLAWTTTP